jgi:Transposase DDE domain
MISFSSSHGRLVYNAQAAVDVETMLVVTQHVTEACNDKKEVVPTLEQVKALPAELGSVETLLADTGFTSAANVEACEAAGIEPLFAQKRESHHIPILERFAPDPVADSFPDPSSMASSTAPALEGKSADVAEDKPVEKPVEKSAVERMSDRLATKAGRALYALRKQTVEPVFGIIKHGMGFRQLSLRGLEKARGEWSLVTMAWNIKRMHVLSAAKGGIQKLQETLQGRSVSKIKEIAISN